MNLFLDVISPGRALVRSPWAPVVLMVVLVVVVVLAVTSRKKRK